MNFKSYYKHYHLMLWPGVILLLIFHIIPMFGIAIAFQDFKLGLGIWKSPWIGFDNFTYLLQLHDSSVIFYNTVFISLCKIIAHLIIPLFFAILLNEVRIMAVKRWVQTIVYLPHFLSWVILAGVVIDLLSLQGVVNHALASFGFEPIMFLASNSWFPAIIIGSDIWKEFGFAAIIYLAALAGINPNLFEAAEMDGANRFQQLLYITLPSLLPTVILLATLSIGNILNAGFDQIFNLYNPLVYDSGDIIDTYVYRVGLVQAQYGFATAVGLMKSVIGFLLIVISYRIAYRYANYRIF
ncbi:ABC transporter permease [Paenibacillus whitsoniae]|uniref:Sugar ABC transporter permease n=1 Tax=Paenibacillus whitsoniae TaxID=2496558 RepID=A0A3S0A2X7_9BACL|nr:ABC transporter permease subunit [Paenibacillus whitsoniae]RTE08281.1 sugar ABC transporter permease [Paenibacillus whitsoniae]